MVHLLRIAFFFIPKRGVRKTILGSKNLNTLDNLSPKLINISNIYLFVLFYELGWDVLIFQSVYFQAEWPVRLNGFPH